MNEENEFDNEFEEEAVFDQTNDFKNPGIFYFPFSELMKHDEFIFHDSNLPEVVNENQFVKTGRNSYKCLITGEVFEIEESLVHRTKVALIPTAEEMAYLCQ